MARSPPTRGMADWRQEALQAIGLALAQSTQRGYFAVYEEFRQFRVHKQLEQMWPISTRIQHFSFLKGHGT